MRLIDLILSSVLLVGCGADNEIKQEANNYVVSIVRDDGSTLTYQFDPALRLCNFGFPIACGAAAFTYERGWLGFVDMGKAIEYNWTACNAGCPSSYEVAQI